MKNYQVNNEGYYGEYGGAYIPDSLKPCVEELKSKYLEILNSDSFKQEFAQLLRDYVGRPSPLYLAKNMSEKYGCRIYLKREDLNHTGAHKINNAIGQVLLAKKMGKKRIIAETGAGQHGVATATVCTLFKMKCTVFMGKEDIRRQKVNVEKMKLLGAEIKEVTRGEGTLKEAVDEAFEYLLNNDEDASSFMTANIVIIIPLPKKARTANNAKAILKRSNGPPP